MKLFKNINLGEKAEFEVFIDEDMHNSFAKLSGDFSPIHTDINFSSKTKFKRNIGYAFLLNSFLSRLYGEYLPRGSSICLKQESKFLNPFFIGDKIKVIGEIIKKSNRQKYWR